MFVCPECASTSDVAGPCHADGTARRARGDDPLIGALVGSYRVAALLGEGGFGRVYKAVHPSIGSRVAIKVLSHDASARADLVERFFAEARIVNHIHHGNIVKVLDLARLEDGRPYILMELLDGATVATLIAQRGPLPIPLVLRIGHEMLAALGAAHAAGIVHRDIKPDNVFVASSGHVKVLDFGVAKLSPHMAQNSPATRTGALLGTPHYMAPEQITGQGIDHRADLYAAAAVLYECLGGRPPFDAPTLYALFQKHVEEEPAPLRSARPELPVALERAVLWGLAKDPAGRPATADAFAAHLGVPPASGELDASAWLAVSKTTPDPALSPTHVSAPDQLSVSGHAPTLHAPTPHGLHEASPAPTGRRWAPILVALTLLLLLGGAGAGWFFYAAPDADDDSDTTARAKRRRKRKKSKRKKRPVPEERREEGDDAPVLADAPGATALPKVGMCKKQPRFEPTSMDMDVVLRWGERVARSEIGPSSLATLQYNEAIDPKGRLDVTRSIASIVQFMFTRPDGRACTFVQISQVVSRCSVLTDCMPPAPKVRCKPSDVMRRGRKKIPKRGNAVGSIMFDAESRNWTVMFGLMGSAYFPDDC